MTMLHSTARNTMQPIERTYLQQSCRYVAKQFEGDVGTTLFDWYEAISQMFFDGSLPQAFLLTALTAYGRCIGLTKPDLQRLPIILIHPTLKTDKARFYTVLHEAIHVHVRYNLGVTSYSSKTSHSNQAWLDEVNRIAKILGYTDVEIGFNKVTRTKKADGGGISRVNTGNVDYSCSYSFPHALESIGPLPEIEQLLHSIRSNMEVQA